ncbi:hypothetical protein ACJ6WE_13480 [Streptomyces sp. MMS24-I31]|uniref:hypothetical protein n=1 Tax=Streptomyces sp. MMS24-I31 TaxID=3351563 RepID=UPI003896A6F2
MDVRLDGDRTLRIAPGPYCTAEGRFPAAAGATVRHNPAAFLIVFRTAVLYLAAGYWKSTGKMWQDGVTMYRTSRVTGFEMSSAHAHLMDNAFVGTAVCYFTIFIELALPFAMLSARPWVPKANTVALEGLHVALMGLMGLMCFGLPTIGADCTCLRDEDHRWLARGFWTVRKRLPQRRWTPLPTLGMTPVAMAAGQDGAADA